MALTDEQIKAYIDNEGDHCPYCESEHGIWNDYADHVKCLNPACEKEWNELTGLNGIEEL